MGRVDPHPPSAASLPDPNLHFNLTIRKIPGRRLACPGRQQKGSCAHSPSPPVPSTPEWERAPPHLRPGHEGVPLAWWRRQRRWCPHREGLTAAQASTMSRDLCPLIVYNRRLFCCSG